MLAGLGAREVPAAYKLSYERVVFGYWLELAAAHKVGPGIANVRDLYNRFSVLLTEACCDHGSTHPGELLVASGGGEDAPVCLPDGVFERLRRREFLENADRYGARYLPGLESADTVGNHEECLVAAFAGEQRVLIVLSYLSRVRHPVGLQYQHALLRAPGGRG